MSQVSLNQLIHQFWHSYDAFNQALKLKFPKQLKKDYQVERILQHISDNPLNTKLEISSLEHKIVQYISDATKVNIKNMDLNSFSIKKDHYVISGELDKNGVVTKIDHRSKPLILSDLLIKKNIILTQLQAPNGECLKEYMPDNTFDQLKTTKHLSEKTLSPKVYQTALAIEKALAPNTSKNELEQLETLKLIEIRDNPYQNPHYVTLENASTPHTISWFQNIQLLSQEISEFNKEG